MTEKHMTMVIDAAKKVVQKRETSELAPEINELAVAIKEYEAFQGNKDMQTIDETMVISPMQLLWEKIKEVMGRNYTFRNGQHYLVCACDYIAPIVAGPFPTAEERDKEALTLKVRDGNDIFMLDIQDRTPILKQYPTSFFPQAQ